MVSKMRVVIVFCLVIGSPSLTSGQFLLPSLAETRNLLNNGQSKLQSLVNTVRTSWDKNLEWFNQQSELTHKEYSDAKYAKLEQKERMFKNSESIQTRMDLGDDQDDESIMDMIKGAIKDPISVLERGRDIFTKSNTVAKAYVGLTQAIYCLKEDEFVDSDLGAFPMNRTLYCNPKCGKIRPHLLPLFHEFLNPGRALKGVLCCNPMTPDSMGVKLRLYLPGSEESSTILDFRDQGQRSLLPKSGRIVFIIHGWVEKMNTSPWMIPMKNLFLETGNADAVIFVDWRYGNQIHYWQAAANVRVVGALIGQAILNWDIADRTLIVGFSLGAQIAGVAGQFTKAKAGVTINECHGLDPAGPFFDGCSKEILLDKEDCKLVQVIHTSAESLNVIGFAAARLGTYHKSGHCDYWINCGYNQGPCLDLDFKTMIRGMKNLIKSNSNNEIESWFQNRFCSHWRAPAVYNSQLAGKCHFAARECPSCSKDSCTKSGRILDTLPPFSKCSPNDNVDYFVQSGMFSPHCEA